MSGISETTDPNRHTLRSGNLGSSGAPIQPFHLRAYLLIGLSQTPVCAEIVAAAVFRRLFMKWRRRGELVAYEKVYQVSGPYLVLTFIDSGGFPPSCSLKLLRP